MEPRLGAFYWVTPIPESWPGDRVESKLREYNFYKLKLLTIHEAMPGHYVQFEFANTVEPKGRRLLRGPPSWVAALTFAPEGDLLIAGSNDGTICLWDSLSGAEVGRLAAHTGPVNALAMTADGAKLASGGADTTALVWDLADLAENRRPGDSAPARDVEALWADLGGADAARAYRAVWSLAATPGQAVPLLQEHLRPAAAPERGELDRLLADLDSDRFEVRAKAGARLEELGELAEPALRRALQGQPSPEIRRRARGAAQSRALPGRARQYRRTRHMADCSR